MSGEKNLPYHSIQQYYTMVTFWLWVKTDKGMYNSLREKKTLSIYLHSMNAQIVFPGSETY